jgi:hypothetical protein
MTTADPESSNSRPEAGLKYSDFRSLVLCALSTNVLVEAEEIIALFILRKTNSRRIAGKERVFVEACPSL